MSDTTTPYKDAMRASFMEKLGDGEPDYEERMIMLEQWEMAWEAAIDFTNAPQPCGHPARYVWPHTGDSGTTYHCLACVLDGDPHSTETDETRTWWRASAIRYSERVEKQLSTERKKNADLVTALGLCQPWHVSALAQDGSATHKCVICGGEYRSHWTNKAPRYQSHEPGCVYAAIEESQT